MTRSYFVKNQVPPNTHWFGFGSTISLGAELFQTSGFYCLHSHSSLQSTWAYSDYSSHECRVHVGERTCSILLQPDKVLSASTCITYTIGNAGRTVSPVLYQLNLAASGTFLQDYKET